MFAKVHIFVIAMILSTMSLTLAGSSTILDADGYACMGDDKTRKDTKSESVKHAKRNAMEFALSHITSETKVLNAQVEKDLLEAYSSAEVKVISMKEIGWYKDDSSGDCFKVQIRAEVLPDEQKASNVAKHVQANDDPSMPLNVRLWTNSKKYKTGEKVKIYLKANKPFYARILYNDASGAILQLLPNPFRTATYFNGGIVYEIPNNEDDFDLTVTPPLGAERISVYASTSPLGEIESSPQGGVYQVKTSAAELGIRTKGINISKKASPSGAAGPDTNKDKTAEYYEDTIAISTNN